MKKPFPRRLRECGWNNVLPFSNDLKPGLPVAERILFAVKQAVVAGQLRPGDRFPSVRVLSQELKVNPSTAHKVVAALVGEGERDFTGQT